jgi:hypothetical protein
MAGISGTLTASVISRLRASSDGINPRLAAIEEADPSLRVAGVRSIVAHNIAIDLSEKSGIAHYPAVLVYCEKVSNTLREKFRQFSGKISLVIEVRYSQDRIDGIETAVQVYVDTVCALLDDARGDWGNGEFYGGGYSVNYDPVGRGGKNFLQRAKINFEVEVSR